jgi:hypothetical protein
METPNNIEDITDPYTVDSGDMIEHKSYPGRQLWVTVNGSSVYLYKSEEDRLKNILFVTASRAGITKRYKSRLPKEKRSIEKTKKKLNFDSEDEAESKVDVLTEQLSNLDISKPFCPPHKMVAHPTLPILFCEYGCKLVQKLDL